jgi:hypothetical protein
MSNSKPVTVVVTGALVDVTGMCFYRKDESKYSITVTLFVPVSLVPDN